MKTFSNNRLQACGLVWLVAAILPVLDVSAAFTLDGIDFSRVGNAGNSADTTGYGAVNYDYYIGTYEVTNSQYTSFLNAVAATDTYGLYNSGMGTHPSGGIQQSGSSGGFSYTVKSNMANRPVNFVSFWDAARFSNWLTSGNTEVGVYALGDVSQPVNGTITRNVTAWQAGGVAIANENEWYKAAYYDPDLNAGAGGYWDYAHQSNSIGTGDAHYGNAATIEVGSYEASHYGTYDQGGNVWELLDDIKGDSDHLRVMRGGAYTTSSSNVDWLSRIISGSRSPTREAVDIGFRIGGGAGAGEFCAGAGGTGRGYGRLCAAPAMIASAWSSEEPGSFFSYCVIRSAG